VHRTIDSSEKSTDSAALRIWRICAFFFVASLLISPHPLVRAQDLEPIYGTWRLNLFKSSFLSGPSQYKRVTCKIEPWKDGVKATYDMIGVRGGITHWEWTGRFDGTDYPLQGVDEVMTNAYRKTGTGSYTVVSKLDGRVTTTTTISISADGNVMTVTSPVRNPQGQAVVNTAVYDRR
jgi:hypothetical protein